MTTTRLTAEERAALGLAPGFEGEPRALVLPANTTALGLTRGAMATSLARARPLHDPSLEGFEEMDFGWDPVGEAHFVLAWRGPSPVVQQGGTWRALNGSSGLASGHGLSLAVADRLATLQLRTATAAAALLIGPGKQLRVVELPRPPLDWPRLSDALGAHQVVLRGAVAAALAEGTPLGGAVALGLIGRLHRAPLAANESALLDLLMAAPDGPVARAHRDASALPASALEAIESAALAELSTLDRLEGPLARARARDRLASAAWVLTHHTDRRALLSALEVADAERDAARPAAGVDALLALVAELEPESSWAAGQRDSAG